MGASASATSIFDLFTMLVDDHNLDTLFTTSGSAALNTYLEGWLRFAIQYFVPISDQALTYDEDDQTFSVELSDKNQLFLAQVMVLYWAQKLVQDVTQMNTVITDRDFSVHSAAQNLAAKREYYNMKREEVAQLYQNYAFDGNDWATWRTGVFYS